MSFEDFWNYSVEQVWPLVLLGLTLLAIISLIFYIGWRKCTRRNQYNNELYLPLISSDHSYPPVRATYASIQQESSTAKDETSFQIGWYDYLNREHQKVLHNQKIEAEESRISVETYLRNVFARYDEFKALPVTGRRQEKTWFLVRGNFGDTLRYHVISALAIKRDRWPYQWGKNTSRALKKFLLDMQHDCLLPVEGMEFNLTRQRIILRYSFHLKGSINDYQRQFSPFTTWKDKRGSSLCRFSIRQSVEIMAQVLSGLHFLYYHGIQPLIYLHRSNILIKSFTSKEGGRVQTFRILLTGYESRVLCRDEVTWPAQLAQLSQSDSSYECTHLFMVKYLPAETSLVDLQVTFDMVRIGTLLIELSCGEVMHKDVFSCEKVNRILSTRIRDKADVVTSFRQTVHTILAPMFTTQQWKIPTSLEDVCKLPLFLPYTEEIKGGTIYTSPTLRAETFKVFQYEGATVAERGTTAPKLKKRTSTPSFAPAPVADTEGKKSYVTPTQSFPNFENDSTRRRSTAIPVNPKPKSDLGQQRRHTTFQTAARSLEDNGVGFIRTTSTPPPMPPAPPLPPPLPSSSLPNPVPFSPPGDRSGLLSAIRQGTRLKPVTNSQDRSAPRI